ncbi:MAG: hypothetical protein GY861_21030 [bacterium]|nr:hypothetical protein [bacterium]
MKKIPSLFKRNYGGDRLVIAEYVPGTGWVAEEGTPTVKFDGTCCMVRSLALFRRYDRKLTRAGKRRSIQRGYVVSISDFKDAPLGWERAEKYPNIHTGHWPGWVEVDISKVQDKYHIEGFKNDPSIADGTYELVGPKIGVNPYNLDHHELWRHGSWVLENVPTTYEGLKRYLETFEGEGIVWHRDNGDMAKIKRRDFGYSWPTECIAGE